MRAIGIVLGVAAALSLELAPAASTPAPPRAVGAVYTMTNDPAGNGVLAYARQADGQLSPAGLFMTGGEGSGDGLGNQGALALTDSQRWLFVVNPGSHDVSSFAVTRDGLRLVHRVPSGGQRPISLTVNRHLLYVLNAGGQTGGEDTIAGFRIGPRGRLFPIRGSRQSLSASSTGPAQISFSPDGDTLVVTEKGTNLIDTFQVNRMGIAQRGTPFMSAGPTPFGFAFGRRDILVVSEAFGGAPDASALSSYEVTEDGGLALISASVLTTETAACWVAITNDGRFAYTTNAGSGTISGYFIEFDGSLYLMDPDGVTADTGPGSVPLDLAFSRNGRYLYSLNSGTSSLGVFRVEADGSLTPRDGVSGLPAGANGLAAR